MSLAGTDQHCSMPTADAHHPRLRGERLHVEFATGEIPSFVHLYAGEEASAAGVMAHLRDDDCIASTHRGHGHCIAKGRRRARHDGESMKKTGVCQGKGGSMHIADLEKGMLGANGIVGAGAPLGRRRRAGGKLKGSDAVAVAFFGDGGSNEGAVFEAMNLAAVWNLPCLFSPRTTAIPRPPRPTGRWPPTTSPTAPPVSACPG